jgi:hypothetical protein
MVMTPIIITALQKKAWFRSRRWLSGPIQTLLCGFFLFFSTPIGCALYPQRSQINVSKLEPKVRAEIEKQPNAPMIVYYNKGL